MPILSDREIIIQNRISPNTKSLTIKEMVNEENAIAYATKNYAYRIYLNNTNKDMSRKKVFIHKNLQENKYSGFKYVSHMVFNFQDPNNCLNSFVIFARHSINISLVKI